MPVQYVGSTTYTESPSGATSVGTYPIPGTPCPAQANEDIAITVIASTLSQCENTNNYTVYLESTRSTFGNGVADCSWNMITGSSNLKCSPSFDFQATTATSPTDYNRFYIRVTDALPGGYCTWSQTMSRQDFWQCQGRPCAYGGTGCGKDGGGQCGSPIILDISGQGFNLTNAANGVSFDITGTGTPVQMGWIAPGANNAFLTLPGADGLVHNGQQLFGNFTPQPASTTPNGFAALAVYDDPKNGGNGDGMIDSRDAVFASLRLWIDANHDGISQPEELHTLPSLGVTSISLNYKVAQRTDQFGNVFRYRAQVDPGDTTNTGRMAYDVFFVTLPPPTTKNILPSLIPADSRKCVVPVPTKGGWLSTSGR